MSTPVAAARAAQDSTLLEIVARIGYIVLGIVHNIIGVIAISVATGGRGEADQDGAMQQIRNTPVGGLLLGIVALGLLGLAVWQVTEAVLERDADLKRRWGYRLKYIGTAVVYLAIAWTALVYAFGGETDSSESSESFTSGMLATSAGVVVLFVIGVIVGGIGSAFVVRGVTRGFEKHLALPDGVAENGIVTFGVVGYVAKGIAIALAGSLFVIAAMTHDPDQAGGLDTALHSLAALPFGEVILWTVGAGLVIYGLFCFGRARYAKM